MFKRLFGFVCLFATVDVSFAQQVPTTDIKAEQLIQFLSRGFGHAEVVMGSAQNWSTYSSKGSQYISLVFGDVYAVGEVWRTSSYVRGTNFYQKIELYELRNGKRIVKYLTNSERKFGAVQQSLLSKSVEVTTGEYLFINDVHYRYKGNTDWEYRAENIEYDESYRTYQIVFYPSDLYRFMEFTIAWEKVVNSGYDEDKLDNFITLYPLSPYIQNAILKLQEIKFNNLKGSDDIDEIDNFIKKYPGSRYTPELNSRKEEIEYRRVLNSGDKNTINARLLVEKNADRRLELRKVYHKLKYNEFTASLDKIALLPDKISFIKRSKSEFDATEFAHTIQQKLEEVEFLILPEQGGVECNRLQKYTVDYPSSRYLSAVKDRYNQCLEIVKKNRMIDSLNLIYNVLKKTTQYQKIIEIAENILTLHNGRNATIREQIKEYKDLYAFIMERRYKIYDLQQADPARYKSKGDLLRTTLLDKFTEYRDVAFSIEVKYSIDTLGAVGTRVNGNCPKGFRTDVAVAVGKGFQGNVIIKNYPVMAECLYAVNYSSKTQIIGLNCSKEGGFTFADNKTSSQVRNSVLNYLDRNESSFKPGKYTVFVDELSCNGENRNWMNITSYRSFTGITAVIPALVIPGLGTKLVTGKKGKSWITWVTYSMAGVGLYYWNQSISTHKKYTAATTQADMERLYAQYEKERGYAVSGILGGGALYSVNLAYVLLKGTGNSFRTLKYRNLYKKTSSRI